MKLEKDEIMSSIFIISFCTPKFICLSSLDSLIITVNIHLFSFRLIVCIVTVI